MNLQTAQTMRGGADAIESTSALLRDLIDYAGLFPPASLTMASSVANYDTYSRSHWNWILGRFVVPVARLGEFGEVFLRLPLSASGIETWRLSALLGSDPAADCVCIREFNARMAAFNSNRRAVVESVEVRAANAEEIVQISGIIPGELATYFEIPLSSGEECIAAVARCERRAKIRTGGETADKFPAPENVIEFIRLCSAANVPFKATAGLHHPLRSIHHLTYQADSPSAMMHGFLNLFLAAAFLRTGMESKVAVELLEEKSADSIHFDSDGVGWRRYRLSRQQIAAARHGFSVSFGSCSFIEPIEDLCSLHLL